MIQLNIKHIESDPVLQIGEGNFRLADIKQMRITEDFTSLDEETRKCQTEYRIEDCITNMYLENLKSICKCLPFNLQNYSSNEEVGGLSFLFLTFNENLLFQVRLCKGREDMRCRKDVEFPVKKCLKPCEGLYFDVKKDKVEVEQAAQYDLLMSKYENYTWFQEDNSIPNFQGLLF